MFCANCGTLMDDALATCPSCGTPPSLPPDLKYCHTCGSRIALAAVTCVHCGVRVTGTAGADRAAQSLFPERGHSWLITLLLVAIAGPLGVHRFYTGHILTGILFFFTGGGLGIWWIIDLVRIALGSFRDDEGLRLVK